MATMVDTVERPGIRAMEIPDTPQGRQAVVDLSQKMADLNKGKLPPRIPREIQRESARTAVYIFNAGRRKQDLTMASYGAWNFVPGCVTKEELAALPPNIAAQYVECAPGEFSAPYVVPGIPYEPYWKEGSRAEPLFAGEEDAEDTGYTMALSAIGIGKNQNRRRSLESFGVFVARTSPPTVQEWAKAKKAWYGKCREECNEANEAHKLGRFLGDRGVAQKDHYEAARILIAAGLAKSSDFAWLDTQAEASTIPEHCPHCGTPMGAELSTCPNCKAVTNWLKKLRADKKTGKRLTAEEQEQLAELELEAATAPDAKKAKR